MDENQAASSAIATVSHLNRSYGSWRAVKDVSFSLDPGITGLLGPNGAGKSSLLTCLAGIARWDDGEISVDGINLARKPTEARRRMGFMPERVAFPAEMRVEDYLLFVAAVKGIPKKERRDTVEEIMPLMGLDHNRARIIGNLSKGYRQRVGMAQALLGDPPLALLDEPMAGLDPLNVIEMRDALRDYAVRGHAVLVSTHLLPDARLLCDRIIVMSRGEVVYDGETAGMATEGGGRVRVRLRLRGEATNGAVPSLVEGTSLFHHQSSGNGAHLMIVDGDDEERIAVLVRALSADWSVLSVEPTMDVLEDAFKRAVLGTGDPDAKSSEGTVK